MPLLNFAVPILLAAIGILEFIHPFGPAFLRNMPALWIIIAVLLAARHGAKITARNRRRMIDAVPRRPLGLSEDD